MFKLYDSGDSHRQSHLAGVLGWINNYQICNSGGSGSSAANCETPYYVYPGTTDYDSVTGKWYVNRYVAHGTFGREIWSMVEGRNAVLE